MVQFPFPFSPYSDENLMLFYPSLHYRHDSQIAIMFNGFSHCQSGMEADQSLEDEGSIFAHF